MKKRVKKITEKDEVKEVVLGIFTAEVFLGWESMSLTAPKISLLRIIPSGFGNCSVFGPKKKNPETFAPGWVGDWDNLACT